MVADTLGDWQGKLCDKSRQVTIALRKGDKYVTGGNLH